MELLEKILSGGNIADAINKVIGNKGSAGVDRINTTEFMERFNKGEINFEIIKEQIRNRKYKPQPVLRVEIPKENGKKRNLGIPAVIDRIIQQAIVQVLSPIYEEQFSNSSYGFRPKRSCEMAIVKVLELFNDGYTWIVDIDLEKFFDTVNQDRLMNIISKTINDGDVISLIRKFLQSGVMINGVINDTNIGTPQGGNLSPLLSNIMLNELDKELEARELNFVRYADDCLIVVKSEKSANRVMNSIKTFIEKKLGLKVNIEKSKIAKPKDIKYLGFGFYTSKQGTIKSKPHLKSVEKFKRTLKRLTNRSYSISLDERITKLNYVIRGWINYFKIADMKVVTTRIGELLRHRIRTIIWKYWKKPMTKYKNLRKLGITHESAYMVANTRKGYFWVAKTVILHMAVSNKRLKQKGLVFPLDHYLKVHI
ncbi:group II intron reverse transcriptase/maturase [Clostridium sp.]|uniref:group II intron reverse transcriptase/maturase n=1 Tax=Clostridium sp. TaxID=1506 RepID=UPI002FC86FE7